MQETWILSLGWEDPLEEGMATNSSILAWRIPMDRGACQATVHGVTKSWTKLQRLSTRASTLTRLWLHPRTPPIFVAQTVKNLPAMQETWVPSLDQEDPLEKGMVTHSSILAWRIPVDRGACQATVQGVAKS